MSEGHYLAQNRRYCEIENDVFRIVHSADGDTDDLIVALAEWAFDYTEKLLGDQP